MDFHSLQYANRLARKLKKLLRDKYGSDVIHAECLDAVAIGFGRANWTDLSNAWYRDIGIGCWCTEQAVSSLPCSPGTARAAINELLASVYPSAPRQPRIDPEFLWAWHHRG